MNCSERCFNAKLRTVPNRVAARDQSNAKYSQPSFESSVGTIPLLVRSSFVARHPFVEVDDFAFLKASRNDQVIACHLRCDDSVWTQSSTEDEETAEEVFLGRDEALTLLHCEELTEQCAEVQLRFPCAQHLSHWRSIAIDCSGCDCNTLSRFPLSAARRRLENRGPFAMPASITTVTADSTLLRLPLRCTERRSATDFSSVDPPPCTYSEFAVVHPRFTAVHFINDAENCQSLRASCITSHFHAFDVVETASIRQLLSLLQSNWASHGVLHCKTILAVGASGCGKTVAIEHIACTLNAFLVRISLSKMLQTHPGEPWWALKAALDEAMLLIPSRVIIALDRVDLLFAAHSDQRAFVNMFETLYARMTDDRITLIATTHSTAPLPSRVLQLFDDIVNISLCDDEERRKVFRAHLRRELHVDVSLLRGLRCADIALAASRAVDMDTANRALHLARQRIRVPNSLHSDDYERPSVSFTDVGGYHALKDELRAACHDILFHSKPLVDAGFESAIGIILHGPPGTGKTLLARSLAGEISAHFVALDLSSTVRSEVGEGEKALVALFERAARLRPCVIFIDEFQSVFGANNALLSSCLLAEMDEIARLGGVLVLAATNALHAIEKRFFHRFSRVLHVPPPDLQSRNSIIRLCLHKFNINFHEGSKDFHNLVALTEGFTGAQIQHIFRQTVLRAIQQGGKERQIACCDVVLSVQKGVNKKIAAPEP